MIAGHARWALPLLWSLLLSGCVGGLLGGGKPDQLYRFGRTEAIPKAGAAPVRARAVELLPPRFAPELAGDRIQTTDGRATAYVKDARWSSAAPTLYAAALQAAFAERTADIVVVERRDVRGAGQATLRVEVTRFEAAYAGEKSIPTVLVEGEAALVGAKGGKVLGTYRFAERQPAAADRVVDIAAAFDAVVARAVAGTVDWTSATMPQASTAR